MNLEGFFHFAWHCESCMSHINVFLHRTGDVLGGEKCFSAAERVNLLHLPLRCRKIAGDQYQTRSYITFRVSFVVRPGCLALTHLHQQLSSQIGQINKR